MTIKSRQPPNPAGKTSRLPAGTISTGRAARMLGVDEQTLQRWVRQRWAKPVRVGSGRGAVLGWRPNDLIAARVARKLRERVSGKMLSKIVNALDRHTSSDLSSAVLLWDQRLRRPVQIIDREHAIEVVTRQGLLHGEHLVPLGEIDRDVRREIAMLRTA